MTEFWYSHVRLHRLATFLHECEGWGTEQILEMLEKPWRFHDEYREMLSEQEKADAETRAIS